MKLRKWESRGLEGVRGGVLGDDGVTEGSVMGSRGGDRDERDESGKKEESGEKRSHG